MSDAPGCLFFVFVSFVRFDLCAAVTLVAGSLSSPNTTMEGGVQILSTQKGGDWFGFTINGTASLGSILVNFGPDRHPFIYSCASLWTATSTGWSHAKLWFCFASNTSFCWFLVPAQTQRLARPCFA